MTADKAVPVALPVAWSNNRSGNRESRRSERTRATTTTRSPRASVVRVGRRGLSAVRESLSDRDMAVVRDVDAHRFLTSRQIESFRFADHATALTGARVARRVLRRLAELRVIASLERRVGGVRAGSASYVWRVGAVGDRMLRQERGGARRRQREPGSLFLAHCLAVADVHLDLVRADREGRLELIDVQLEPQCWRPFTGLGGGRLKLQPDLYVVTGDPIDRDYVNTWFVEVDRGSEHPARLVAKCRQYEAYRQTGAEQRDGGGFPFVVWVIPDEQRAERLRVAVQHAADLDATLYRITTPDDFIGVISGRVS